MVFMNIFTTWTLKGVCLKFLKRLLFLWLFINLLIMGWVSIRELERGKYKGISICFDFEGGWFTHLSLTWLTNIYVGIIYLWLWLLPLEWEYYWGLSSNLNLYRSSISSFSFSSEASPVLDLITMLSTKHNWLNKLSTGVIMQQCLWLIHFELVDSFDASWRL